MQLFYFYIDEGGLLGNCNICISKSKLKYEDSRYDSHICNYYFGRISISSIERHVQLFSQLNPFCGIGFDPLSDIKEINMEEAHA